MTSPNGGAVTITESPVGGQPPSGFQLLGQDVNLSAPAATAGNPLVIKFLLDGSVIAGMDINSIEVFKNGVVVAGCTGAPGTASPDPCVSLRQMVGDDLEITVLSSTASLWQFGVALATPTPSPTPGPFHDAGIKRIASPTGVRLNPGIPDTKGPLTVVVANSSSNHQDDVGVYLALLPPGGSSNPGGCSPALVMNLGVFSLLPGGRITIRIDPPWQCANPAAVDGQTWTLKAVADVHADDFAECATLAQVFDSSCSLAISDDDDNDTNNFRTRARPRVVSLAP